MNESLREATVHGSSDFPFALYHIHAVNFIGSIALHWHDEMEIIYVQEGILHVTIEDVNYTLYPGDIYIVNSREIHAMSVDVNPTIYITALFPLSSLVFESTDAVNEKYLKPLADNILCFPNEIKGFPDLQAKLEKLIMLYEEKPTAYMLRIRILLLDIVCEFFEGNILKRKPQVPKYKEKQLEILYYINEHYQAELSLDIIANAFHMAPKYFSRYFKNTFHLGLTEYINRLRLEKATELLKDTDLSMTEIALQCGFNSSSYFNKTFKAAVGKTPSEYRQGI